MEQSGLKQSKFDIYLFVGEKVTCNLHVDDIIFWARNEDDIHNLEMHLCQLGVDLDHKDYAAGLLKSEFGGEKGKQYSLR